MFELDALIHQVRHNCHVSDSQHAGMYSICGLALRLRDLYKWENGLDPWVEEDPARVLDWIGNREEKWDKLAKKNFDEIQIFGNKYDPFDSRAINAALASYDLFYGAGYAHRLKPSFFLAKIEEKRKIDGYTVYLLGHELARDLLTIPALSQDDCILVRKESAKLFLWDNIFFIKNSGRPALKFALRIHGLKDSDPKQLKKNFAKICGAEIETCIYHELGELKDTVFDRKLWREIIAAFPHTPIELLARSVKDLLADTNEYGALRHIIRKRKAASLAFYVAFRDGLTKELFPELQPAFQEFMQTSNWQAVEQAIALAYDTAKYYAETMSNIYQEGKNQRDKKWSAGKIEKCLLAPLGLVRKSDETSRRATVRFDGARNAVLKTPKL